MRKRFELFVALRYLMAKRKQAVISIITGISIVGVAAGVMAIIIALAITNGMRHTLQRNLLAATGHVTVLEKTPQFGIENWQTLLPPLKKLPHVVEAAPSLYVAGIIFHAVTASGGNLRGILAPSEATPPLTLQHLQQGAFGDWKPPRSGMPPILLGSGLAHTIGAKVGQPISVTSFQGEMTPFGPRPRTFEFRVAGIFHSGFFEFDDGWAFAPLDATQQILQVDDVVNAIDMTLDDVYQARPVAAAAEKILPPELGTTNWMDQNERLLGALDMEKIVTVITIGLIQLVAALNILISLIMMVMEKHRDIAILMSMGTRREQIRRIFILQGLLIGVVGTVLGEIAGYTLSYFANRYQWIPLREEIYSMAFVPFESRAMDGVWVAAVALLIALLATIYPARTATRIAPAEALRYE